MNKIKYKIDSNIIAAWLWAFGLSICLSCSKKEDCPEDIYLGHLNLGVQSSQFLPYAGIRFLEFIDSTGQEIAVLYDPNGMLSDTARTLIENICLEDEQRADKYYTSEHLTVNYFDLDTSRKFRILGNLGIREDVLSRLSTSEDPVLYDELKLTVHRTNPSISGAVATLVYAVDDRGNESRYSDSLRLQTARFKPEAMVRVNDSIYTDVYSFGKNDTTIYFYFKPQIGVVAFQSLDSTWWNFHRKY